MNRFKRLPYFVVFILFQSINAHATSFQTDDTCILAAIEQTYEEFPLGVKTKGRFYEWFSGTSSGWQSFSGIRNLGPKFARYASAEEILKAINSNYFVAEDSPRKLALIRFVQGKKILAINFRFSDSCDLLRYFAVEHEGASKCQIMHIDTKIDDFDNG